jgi:hypothetical protein
MTAPLSESLPQGSAAPMHEILITSHSPFIVSDCPRQYVYIFDKDNPARYTHPRYQTFGASVNFLTNDVFGKRETISQLGQQFIEQLMREAAAATNAETFADIRRRADEELGDSVEKIFLYDYLSQREREIEIEAEEERREVKKKVIKKPVKKKATKKVVKKKPVKKVMKKKGR